MLSACDSETEARGGNLKFQKQALPAWARRWALPWWAQGPTWSPRHVAAYFPYLPVNLLTSNFFTSTPSLNSLKSSEKRKFAPI